MKKILLIGFICIPLVLFSQKKIDSLSEANDKEKIELQNWMEKLQEKGIEQKGDSIVVSEEYLKVLNNENYRKIVYPKKYSWEIVTALIRLKQLKIVFWHLINLYHLKKENKEKVLQSMIMYDRAFPMDVMLTASFNTYIYLDPEVSVIKNGDSEITRPDILEEKLRGLNEIINYIQTFKEQQKKDKKDEN